MCNFKTVKMPSKPRNWLWLKRQDQDNEPDTVVVATSNDNPPATRPTDTWGDVLMDSGEEDNDISQDEEESIREEMQNYFKEKRSGIATETRQP